MKNIRRKFCIVIISMIIIICSCNVFKVFANTSDKLKSNNKKIEKKLKKLRLNKKL